MDIKVELARLKGLYDEGLIDEAEYRKEKEALLSSARVGSTPSPSFTGGGGKTAMVISEEVSLFLAGATIGPDDRPYKLDKRLGAGGMGQVWRALDIKDSESLDREVWKAIKILPVTAESDLGQYKALRQEAYLAEQLRHPHIISVSGWREDKISGYPFIVMEWLEGKDLSTVLAEEGEPGLLFQRVIELVDPVIEALDYAWKKHQLVHRDIKPANIFLTNCGEIKLLDFGIAARIGKTSSSIGIKGREQAGTPGYRPPEARAKRKPAPSWDVYGLGALTYELLTGEAPFSDDRAPYTPLPDKPEYLNKAQWQVLLKAISFEEEKRYQSVKEYWQAIQGADGPSEEEIERKKQEEATLAAAQAAAAEKAARNAEENAAQERARKETQEREEAERREAARKAKEETEKQEDENLWQAARQKNTEQAYHDYLSKSQRLAYKQLALGKITELKENAEKERVRKEAQAEAERLEATRKAEQERVQKEAQAAQERIRRAAEEAKQQDAITQNTPSTRPVPPSGKKFSLVGLVVGIVVVIGLLLTFGRGKKEEPITAPASSAPAVSSTQAVAAPVAQPTVADKAAAQQLKKERQQLEKEKRQLADERLAQEQRRIADERAAQVQRRATEERVAQDQRRAELAAQDQRRANEIARRVDEARAAGIDNGKCADPAGTGGFVSCEYLVDHPCYEIEMKWGLMRKLNGPPCDARKERRY